MSALNEILAKSAKAERIYKRLTGEDMENGQAVMGIISNDPALYAKYVKEVRKAALDQPDGESSYMKKIMDHVHQIMREDGSSEQDTLMEFLKTDEGAALYENHVRWLRKDPSIYNLDQERKPRV